MRHAFTMEYWPDTGGYVGRLREIPAVFSQGDTLDELEENLRDAYELVVSDMALDPIPVGAERKSIEVEV